MAFNCSICLNIFKEPVCLPCGHIYCSKCLSDHVNAPPHRGMTASCPECRTNFNLFTPELACLPRQYHNFILPSVRRVYLDLAACSALQVKLEQAEEHLQVHKSHEEALARRCESLFAALEAHRAGETKALHNLKVLKKKMASQLEDRQQDLNDEISRNQKLDKEYTLLQDKYTKAQLRCHQLDEQVLAYARQAEQTEERESRIQRSDPSKKLTMELRAMKPIPKRRVYRRTRSNSPPPIDDNLVKRVRLSQGHL